MVAWSDGYWVSSDGLKLHYRDYAGGASRPPILCIPGLTRNARNFEGVADRLGGGWGGPFGELRGGGRCGARGGGGARRPPRVGFRFSFSPFFSPQVGGALIAALDLDRFVLFG